MLAYAHISSLGYLWFLLLKFNQFLSKFFGSLLLVFFHLVFVISVHFDLAQVVSVFFTKPPPSSQRPVEELKNPLIT